MATTLDLASIRRVTGAPTLFEKYDDAKIEEFILNSTTMQKGEHGRVLPDEGITVDELKAEGGLKIFTNVLCPFANRAYWALIEKDVLSEFDYIHIQLGKTKPKWYQANGINPAGTVPAIWDNGVPVFESSVNVEYLEDKFPGRGVALFPEDAAQKAKVRVLVNTFNEKFIGPMYQLLMNKDPALDAEKAETVRAKVEALNELYAAGSESGPWFLGETFSAADINVVPFLARFVHTLGYWRGFDLLPEGDEKTARLRALLAAAESRPAFTSTFPSAEYFIAAYFTYAGGVVPDTE